MNRKNLFLVGGAVRDSILGLPINDRDWVLINSTQQEMLDEGHSLVGKDFPVFLVDGEEVALARTERKTGKGYNGFSCDVADVTLEEDLARRDLTINAIAMDNDNNFIDPHNGIDDLRNGILRHTSNAFMEDPVRVLRLARFLARYHNLSFTVDPSTVQMAKDMVSAGELNHLVSERVWQEIEKTLGEASPWVFFEFLHDVGALAVIMPEIDNLFGVPQPEKHHPEIDTWVHVKMVLKRVCLESNDKSIRFAALMHDIGKGVTPVHILPSHHAHELNGLKLFKKMKKRLKIPNHFNRLAEMVIEFHTHSHRLLEMKAGKCLTLLTNLGEFRQGSLLESFAFVCKHDALGRLNRENEKYKQFDFLMALRAVKHVDHSDLVEKYGEGLRLKQNIDQRRTREIIRIKAWMSFMEDTIE